MRVLLIDKDRLFREGLARLLQDRGAFQVVEAGSAAEALHLAQPEAPDLILTEAPLPDAAGMDGVRRLKHALPSVPVMVLSTTHGADEAVAAFRAGAAGFVPKSISIDGLIASLRGVADGEVALSRALTASLLPYLRSSAAEHDEHAPWLPASGAEHAILVLLLQRAAANQLAQELELPEAAVRLHLQSLLTSLNAEKPGQSAG